MITLDSHLFYVFNQSLTNNIVTKVSIVCEKLIRDREEQIKEQYDKILTSKLAGLILYFKIICLSLYKNYNHIRNTLLSLNITCILSIFIFRTI